MSRRSLHLGISEKLNPEELFWETELETAPVAEVAEWDKGTKNWNQFNLDFTILQQAGDSYIFWSKYLKWVEVHESVNEMLASHIQKYTMNH